MATTQLSIAQTMQAASAAYGTGDLARTETLCRAVIAAEPGHFDATHLLAIVQSRTDRAEAALASYQRALALGPGNAMLFNNRGNILLKLERSEEALASYDQALALDPDNAETLLNRAVCLRALKRYEEALAICDEVIAGRPDDAGAHYNRANVLKDLKRYDEAIAGYDRALASKPGYPDALNNQGNVFLEAKRPDEALARFDQLIAFKPDHADGHLGRGIALFDLARTEEALASYERAIALAPEQGKSHWNQALCRLSLGDFERGWAQYEWRWKSELLPDGRYSSRPLWLGREDIRGKTILLHAEQGLGDTIQFCRYARLAAQRGARVILEVQRSLAALLAGLAGPSEVVAKGDPLPPFDFHCPLMSLPLAFATRLDSVPAEIPYLSPSAELARSLAQRLSRFSGLRVGLAWSGNPQNKRDRERSIPLDRFAPILSLPNIQFISLQKEVTEQDADAMRRNPSLIELRPEMQDFSRTAAVISVLDLVISVDTAMVHLAGALARPTFVLLPFAPDFRWLRDRDDSPWYPTVRLFRQGARAQWEPVIDRVAQALAAMAARAERSRRCMVPGEPR